MSKEYVAEFRQQMVELVRAGRSPEELERQFQPTAKTIRNWLKQAQGGAGDRGADLNLTERQELGRLRREVKLLKLEREILSKAAAWFARETKAAPSTDTDS